MPWTEITRRQYRRDQPRYASDLNDDEWALIEPHLPAPRTLGRPRTTDLRAVVDALLYVLASGRQWRMLSKERFFYRWREEGRWNRINHGRMMRAREALGRAASPSAAVIDSESVKTTEAGGPRGYDAGKKIKGRKRHVLTDTTGLLVARVHEASVQDRDGAVPLLASIRSRLPWLRQIFADGAYTGAKLADALAGHGRWTVEIVKRAPMRPRASSCCRDAGWSSARLPGSTATAGSPRTSRRRSPAPPRGSCWPASSHSHDGWRDNVQPKGLQIGH